MTKAVNDATQEFLLDAFEYCPEGQLLRKRRSDNNKMPAGSLIGYEGNKKYWRAKVCGRRQMLHRLVWIWHNGEIPENTDVDHFDTNKANNRIENLRLLPKGDNKKASHVVRRSNNTSGEVGVSRRTDSKGKEWRATIRTNGKQKSKCFDTMQEAIDQRKEWEIEFGYRAIENNIT